MKAQEKYGLIWSQICDKIKSLNLPGMTLSVEHSRGYCDGASWYGENILTDDDYLHITPIEKCGREVFGTVKYSTKLEVVFGEYRTYEEFERMLDEFIEAANKLRDQ